jgi:hypothetical protein
MLLDDVGLQLTPNATRRRGLKRALLRTWNELLVFGGLQIFALGLKMYLSLERTNQPRKLGQANRRSEYHSQAEPRLTHAPEPEAVMAEGKPGEQESDGVFALLALPERDGTPNRQLSDLIGGHL